MLTEASSPDYSLLTGTKDPPLWTTRGVSAWILNRLVAMGLARAKWPTSGCSSGDLSQLQTERPQIAETGGGLCPSSVLAQGPLQDPGQCLGGRVCSSQPGRLPPSSGAGAGDAAEAPPPPAQGAGPPSPKPAAPRGAVLEGTLAPSGAAGQRQGGHADEAHAVRDRGQGPPHARWGWGGAPGLRGVCRRRPPPGKATSPQTTPAHRPPGRPAGVRGTAHLEFRISSTCLGVSAKMHGLS